MRLPTSVIMGREGSYLITVITPDRNSLKGVGSLGLLVSVTSIHETPGSSCHNSQEAERKECHLYAFCPVKSPSLCDADTHIKNEFFPKLFLSKNVPKGRIRGVPQSFKKLQVEPSWQDESSQEWTKTHCQYLS